MAEEFDDEQIRIELKRLVEDLRANLLRKLCDVESEAALTHDVTESQLRGLNERVEQSKGKMSLRFQQMIDFIDRQ